MTSAPPTPAAQVRSDLFQAMGVTLRMIALAALLALILGVLLGVVSAVRSSTASSTTPPQRSGFLFYSIPVVWLAGLLKIVRYQESTRASTTPISSPWATRRRA